MIWLFPKIEFIKINKSINAQNLPFYPIVWHQLINKNKNKNKNITKTEAEKSLSDGADEAGTQRYFPETKIITS